MTRTTNSGGPAENPENASAPTERTLPDGQKADHWILPEEERAKGFVRPVRTNYRHVGPHGPAFPLRDLTAEERERFGDGEFVKFEPYPDEYRGSARGRYWTQEEIDKVGNGCGTVTSMPAAIAETYARQPGYYGSTFCCGCNDYLPVGERGEFVWNGSDERVGT